jgi:preprotein translocase subunit SecG
VVDVRLNGEAVANSPTFVKLFPPECGHLESADDAGVCVCRDGTTHAFGGCRHNGQLAAEVTAMVVSVLLVLAVLLAWCARHRSDKTWIIQAEDLTFSNPPSTLLASHAT